MITKNIASKVHIKTTGERNIELLRLKGILLGFVIVLLLTLIIYYFMSGNSNKAVVNTGMGNVSYISVSITADDTLWSIAGRYYSDEFGTIKDYVKEIKRCNSLKSDNIYAGRNIIVPVIYHDTDYIYDTAGA
ncbi:MAG: LysM peptidoglycan-binding domain-containing protein [Lachnospiraceae bacterium]|nr:LysM peptidoglycan-binding domain-containing protein [Lachnospiraceae bacterium]